MRRKTFILGTGGQKCGTTWLHRYIAQARSADFGALKEYHIWDALSIPLCAGYRVPSALADLAETERLRLRMQTDPTAYFDYFRDLLQKEGVDLTGDLSPSYAGLKRSILKEIRDGFDRRSVDCKAIFIMRDPVERCLSAFTMHLANGRINIQLDEESAVRDHMCNAGYAMRTRYDLTLGELDAVFPEGNAFYAIYEELFSQSQVARLSDYVGIPCRFERIAERINTARRELRFSEAVRSAVARHYGPVYEYMARRFPQTCNLWPGFKYL